MLRCVAGLLFGIAICLPVVAQQHYFFKTGRIRAVVAETAPAAPGWRGSIQDPDFSYRGTSLSKTDFYFTYSSVAAGHVTEKWIALPRDRKWSIYSNDEVELSAQLAAGGQLTN